MTQRSRFAGPAEEPGGDAKREKRLRTQLEAVRDLMLDHGWWTLEDISTLVRARYGVRCPPASASAQLRHLRKPKFGGYIVNKKHLGDGLYEYQLLSPQRPRTKQTNLFDDGDPLAGVGQ